MPSESSTTKPTICPICSGSLEERVVAPCFDCGHAPEEIKEYEQGYHKYHVFSLWGEELVLCDFCDADFGSYYPDYFGLPEGLPLEYPLELVRQLEKPLLSKDLYCHQCKHRLAFLSFLANVRVHNAG